MADNSKIEWCDATFNPWIGCTAVSPACDHCYAERWGARFGVQWGNHPRRRTSAANWREPLKWNRAAKTTGIRKRVFCASLADVFDNQVPSEWRADLWALIAECDGLDWLLLTKRPQNISRMLPEQWGGKGWPNVWLGMTAENQEEYDRRWPHLRAVPVRVHFVSMEPLLGPIFFRPDKPSWVITGGESGPTARGTLRAWFRDIRDQCVAQGTPYLHKQNGEWIDADEWMEMIKRGEREIVPGERFSATETPLDYSTAAFLADFGGHRYEHLSDGTTLIRVGKLGAGRLLDERTWDEFPRG